jgi:hypothetical protein
VLLGTACAVFRSGNALLGSSVNGVREVLASCETDLAAGYRVRPRDWPGGGTVVHGQKMCRDLERNGCGRATATVITGAVQSGYGSLVHGSLSSATHSLGVIPSVSEGPGWKGGAQIQFHAPAQVPR